MTENQEKLTNYDVFFRALGPEKVQFVDSFLRICKQVDVSVFDSKVAQEIYIKRRTEKLSRILDNHKDQEPDIINILKVKEDYYRQKSMQCTALIREQKKISLSHKHEKIPPLKIKISQVTYKTFHYLTIGLVPTIVFLALLLAALSPLFPPLTVPTSYLTSVLSLTLLVKTVGIVTLASRYITRKIYKKYQKTNDEHDRHIEKTQEKAKKYKRKLIVCKILHKITLSALKRNSVPKNKPTVFSTVLRPAAVPQEKKNASDRANTVHHYI